MFLFNENHPAIESAEAPTGGSMPQRRALLFWAEHCVECAAPACYASCDLYDPTPEGKCRRFEHGIVRRKTGRGTAAEVRFRRWGKLETEGNCALWPDRRLVAGESILSAAAPFLARVGRGCARLSGWDSWKRINESIARRITRFLLKRGGSGVIPNRFIAEIENLGGPPVVLLLTAGIDHTRLGRSIAVQQLPSPFIARIDLPPGHSRHELDVAGMAAILRSGLPFNLSLMPQGEDGAHLVFHRLDLAHIADDASTPAPARADAGRAQQAKLVVFDLDNTLWDGVLLEGPVSLRPGVRSLFEQLDARGVLLSIASKNALDDALAQLKAFGLEQFLLHPRIGWLPKSQGIAEIVRALGIGADAVIHVDDSAFERAEVSAALPQVEVLDDGAIATLLAHPRLCGAVTPESRSRRQMYQEAAARESAAESFGNDYLAFLKACDIRVEVRLRQEPDLDRIVELVQRTNQLNFSGRKYSREQIVAILGEPHRTGHVINCSDRHGSYGTVGFCLSHVEEVPEGVALVIDDLMLSCRVQGKFVEQGLLWALLEREDRPISTVRITFRKTDRNRAAQLVLERLGFTPDGEAGYRRNVGPGDFASDLLTIS